jgi:hypothetical protein
MEKYTEDYKDLKDFFAGERVVKAKGERYTPRLEGQKGEKSYCRYVEFGILYNALARTRQGLKGAILRKPIDIQFPESQKESLKTIMKDGSSFEDMTRLICDDVLGYGRIGALVDIDEMEEPYTVLYDALSILSAKTNEILLKEMIEQPKIDAPNETEFVEQHRKLELVNGIFVVTVYRKEAKADGEFIPVQSTKEQPNPRIPMYKGRKLDFIPFTFFGSTSNSFKPSKPPLMDLLNILKGHWRLTVAYQYGLHFAALPTPCFAGFNFEDGQDIPLGPGATHYAADSSAKSWFMQTGGQGLADIEKGLDRLERQMAIVGARLLEEQRPGVEAAETVRLRSSGDSATLSDVAGSIENGLTKVLKDIGFWKGIAVNECNAAVNKDFVSTRLSSQDVAALLQVVQAGKMSEETFLWNLQQGEITQPGSSVEDELERMAEDKAKSDNEGWV